MTPRYWARVGVFIALVVFPDVQPAYGTKFDISPRPAFLLGNTNRMIVLDAWNSVASYGVEDGRLLRRFPAGARVSAIDVSLDERFLAVGCGDGGFSVWDIASGERLWLHPADASIESICRITFSADGNTIGIADSGGTVPIVERHTGRILRTVGSPPVNDIVLSVALAPDGSEGVFVALSQKLYAFGARSGKPEDLKESSIRPVCWSSDGKFIVYPRIVGGGRTQELCVLDLAHKTTRKIDGIARTDNVRPTLGGGFLITAVPDKDPRFATGFHYDPATGTLRELWRSAEADYVSFDPETLLGVWTDYRLQTQLIDLRTGQVRLTIDNSANYRAELISSGYLLGSSESEGAPRSLAPIVLISAAAVLLCLLLALYLYRRP